MDWSPLILSFQLAGITTVCLLLLATPLAWWLAFSRSPVVPVLEAVVALPLVLPPTVLGFYLLLLLGPAGPVGSVWMSVTGDALTFRFSGLVIASVIYSLPFMVQPLSNAFRSMGRQPLDVAATLGASPGHTFISVAVPLAGSGYLTGAVLSFAHTLGEFGVVLMMGGNIPGSTRVVSIAIFDHVESLDYAAAHQLSAVLLATGFLLLLAVYLLRGRRLLTLS